MIDPFELLPNYLAERTRFMDSTDPSRWQAANEGGNYVLYWMQTALRVDENPALDVAKLLAKRLSVPLLVFQSISPESDFASDRHHAFMLEGSRDVQQQLAEQSISYALHMQTSADEDSHIVDLAGPAAYVVTEDMPVDPQRQLVYRLVEATDARVVCVDTACVAPMKMIGKAYTRAFAYRDATKSLYSDRLEFEWPEVACELAQFDLSALNFEPVDLHQQSIADLVARCEIDHAIGPVADTKGGSDAGYQRWNRFKSNGLSGYAKKRNNALLDGVSRMSAYLHHGMVSPFRIAREASKAGGAGAEKFLDELLIWRELAYAFCFYRPDHDRWTGIPDWAQETLEQHASDPRPIVYDWETLARGETDDAFWNAAQKSLLVNGELHNNVRMTWGKQILNWTQSPRRALELMIDLNHRYALDGCDPSSYGGLLWCVGQFDRPFKPEQKIFGTVRPRSSADHAKRLDTESYFSKVATCRIDPVPKVAIVGAGISGLFAARTLHDHGCHVQVFDKGRGVGGRMSTRRLDGVSGFDHGAQYFTARDPRFARYVDAWIQKDLAAKWPDSDDAGPQNIVVLENGVMAFKTDSTTRYVGVPGMNSIAKHLAIDLDVQVNTRVTKVIGESGSLFVHDDQSNQHGPFDRVILTAPAAQTMELLADFPTLAEPVSRIEMDPCWCAMVRFEQPITDDWVGAFIHDSFLSWAARNGTKPDRPTAEHVVIHANPDWTKANWEQPADWVAGQMLDEFWRASGLAKQAHDHLVAHRWKYAIPVNASSERCFSDEEAGIVACGDWAGGPRVEGAFLSGMAAAGRLLGTFHS
jgi:photolyase PhrII